MTRPRSTADAAWGGSLLYQARSGPAARVGTIAHTTTCTDTASRSWAAASAAGSSRSAALQLDRARKQHVVLQVDVPVQIPFEFRQLLHGHRIGAAAGGRRRVAVRSLADGLQAFRGVAMLALHHADRVLHGAERADRAAARAPRLLGEIAHVGKQD